MEKLIITVATTGAMTSKENTPYLPTTPEEIAEEVYAVLYEAGDINIRAPLYGRHSSFAPAPWMHDALIAGRSTRDQGLRA